MGLKAKLVNATFDTIIPAIVAGKYGMGASSFTDTKARQSQVVDFVDYFSAGESFYVKTGSSLITSRTSVSSAVTSIAVESRHHRGDRRQDPGGQVRGRRQAQGRTSSVFDTQTEANVAVSSGRADAGFADSPVAAYIVATSNGVFQNSGAPAGRGPLRPGPPEGLAGCPHRWRGRRQPADLERGLPPDPGQVGRAGRGHHHGHDQRRDQLRSGRIDRADSMTDAPGPTADADGRSGRDPSTLEVVPVRHPWRWVTGAVILVLVGDARQHAAVLPRGPGRHPRRPATSGAWSATTCSPAPVLRGVVVTLELTVIAMAAGILIGVVLAVHATVTQPAPVRGGLALHLVLPGYAGPRPTLLLVRRASAYLYQHIEARRPLLPTRALHPQLEIR